MILGKVWYSFPSAHSLICVISLTITIAFRYKIRGEKGLLRDPTTGIVGPNRKQIRYTELADEMVEKLGRLGQKVKKVCLDICFLCISPCALTIRFVLRPGMV
jgi:hypothetical protein